MDTDKGLVGKALQVAIPRRIGRYEPNYDGFVIIGAGLPRTGTLSLHVALSKLLNGPCYHMASVVEGTVEESDYWVRVLNGEASNKDWIDFLEGRGFRAGVDYPISHHFE